MYWLTHNYARRLEALIEGRALASDAGGETGGETGGSGGGAATGTPDRTLLGGGEGDDAGAGAATGAASAPPPSSWPENWRELAAGEDQRALTALKRFSAPGDVTKALIAAQEKIRSGQYAAIGLPDDPSPEEIADWRKRAGVPEQPEWYGFQFPDTVTVTDADKEELGNFAQWMHERHVPPQAAKAAFEYYTTRMATQQAAADEAAREALIESRADLRNAWPGREFTPNLEFTKDFLGKHFEGDEQTLDAMLEARLPNGMKLGDYAPFVLAMNRIGRTYSMDGPTIAGDSGSGGLSHEEEYKALITKSVDKPREFTDRDKARLLELATYKTRDERRNQAA